MKGTAARAFRTSAMAPKLAWLLVSSDAGGRSHPPESNAGPSHAAAAAAIYALGFVTGAIVMRVEITPSPAPFADKRAGLRRPRGSSAPTSGNPAAAAAQLRAC